MSLYVARIEPGQLVVAAGARVGFGRGVDGDHFRGARLGCAHGEGPGVGKQVEHPALGGPAGDGIAAKSHVREEADPERRGHVDREAAAVLLDQDLQGRLVARYLDRGFGCRLTRERTHAFLVVDTPRSHGGGDGLIELVPPGQGTGREPLHDHEVAVAVDRHSGQSFVFTREEPQGGRALAAQDLPAHGHCALESRGDDTRSWVYPLVRITGNDADRDGVLSIHEAARQKRPVVGDQIHQASRSLGDLARAKRLAKNPGMTEPYASCHIIGQAVDALAQRHSSAVARIRLRWLPPLTA